MDEPCSALDPIATAKIEELIHELRGRYAIVIVTHNMQQAARVSQRTAFFHLGKLVEYGETSEIFTNPEGDRAPRIISPAVTAEETRQWRPPDTRSRRSTTISTSSARRSARWAASPRRRSARRWRRWSSRDLEAAAAVVARDKQDRRARGRGRAPRRPDHRAARADGRRSARGRRRAEDRRRGRADRRLCQEYRQARAERRGQQDPSRSRCCRKWRGSPARWSTNVLDAFAARDADQGGGGVRARQRGRRFLQQHLPRAAHLHDGKSAQHHAGRRTCCSSPRISSGSAIMPPTSPRWSISPPPASISPTAPRAPTPTEIGATDLGA